MIFFRMTPLQRSKSTISETGKMDPKNIDATKLEILKNYSWDTCVQNADQNRQHDELLVEYYDMFAKHRFDVGYKTELKNKLTPEHPLPV